MGHRKTVHHRKPKSLGGTDDASNLAYVKDRQHQAWHTLFSNLDVPEIVKLLNAVWVDPTYTITFHETPTSPCIGERVDGQLEIDFEKANDEEIKRRKNLGKTIY